MTPRHKALAGNLLCAVLVAGAVAVVLVLPGKSGHRPLIPTPTWVQVCAAVCGLLPLLIITVGLAVAGARRTPAAYLLVLGALVVAGLLIGGAWWWKER